MAGSDSRWTRKGPAFAGPFRYIGPGGAPWWVAKKAGVGYSPIARR